MSRSTRIDMDEYFKRRNPFYFLDELHKALSALEEEAKNIIWLYQRDVNLPERKNEVPYETPFMTYLKRRAIRSEGFDPNRLHHIIEDPDPSVDELTRLVGDRNKAERLKQALDYAKGDELEYLYSLEKYRLQRMHIIGWSIIKNAFYVMDWASRVVEAASTASNMIQAFGDELDLPAGMSADLSKLASLAMDVAGYVQRGMGSPKVWAYRIKDEKQTGTVMKVHIKDKKFIMLSQELYTLSNGNVVKFIPVFQKGEEGKDIPDEEKEYWNIPIWGVMAVFIDNTSSIDKGDIIMFLYSAYSRVLTDSFERVYYECWNRLKMVIKKVKLAMDLLQTKQKLITQLMKASPIPEQPPIGEAEIKSAVEGISGGEER